jgi:lysophospholipase L1-like esterase
VAVTLLITELALRMVAPDTLRFAYDFRQAYQYHDRWYTDFEPDVSTPIRLTTSKGYELDFNLSINEFGFRSHGDPETPLNTDPGVRFVHAIGDSFTMGWGVDYEYSYPAVLDTMLSSGYEVLNLGLNGFGATGATEKSLQLMDRFPASFVVYLPTANDYHDDEAAARYAERSQVLHRTMDVVNRARQTTYLASVPFAVRWWIYYRDALGGKPGSATATPTDQLSLRTATGSSNKAIGVQTKRSIERFAETLAEKRVPFLVVGHGDSNVVDDIVLFCQERGIQTLSVAVPASLKLIGDGHFNAQGNRQMAELIYSHLDLGA